MNNLKKYRRFSSAHRLVFYVFMGLFILIGCQKKPRAFVEKPMVVVIPSYNNARWLGANLASILSQDYHNYRVLYIDDCSKDGTSDGVAAFLSSQSIPFASIEFNDDGLEHTVAAKSFQEAIDRIDPAISLILIKNVQRAGALANLYRAIHSTKDDHIIVTVDGDDWFPHNHVLSDLNRDYSLQDIWITHGKLIEYPNGSSNWCQPIPAEYVQKNAFREYRCSSHLRTFYAGLFKKIRLDDLLFEGKFFQMTWDQAIMFPMMEMAGERHVFITDVNYVYNIANNLNDNKVDPELQRRLEGIIRGKERYQRLACNPF